jgi:glycosyltransferase involved in cell wall biosynthesis
VSQTGTQSFPSPPDGKQGWPWTGDDDHTPLAPPARNDARPKVTVITPSFNQGRFLEETIRSVVLQNYTNLEYIIIDGGSTDESVEIIRHYEPWISHWVSEADDGQADALNKGFDRASGEFLCWLNADDVIYQGFIAHRVEEFSVRPQIDMIYGDVHSGWDNDTRGVLRGEPLSFLDMLRTLRVSIPQQSSMWRKTVVDRVGGLDPRWHVVLDREFFLRIARHSRIEYIPGTCGYFRQHGTAKSVAEKTTWVTELPLMYSELFTTENLTPAEKRLKRETMAATHLLCAEILRSLRDWTGFLRHLGHAIRWSPRHALIDYPGARFQGLRRRLGHRSSDTNTGGSGI